MTLDWYKDKSVFITGHTGFKGAWLCRVLRLAGAKITGYALDPPTKENLFDMTEVKSFIHDVREDVRDAEPLARAMKEAEPSVVFHLAAQPLVRASYKDPAATYETNVMGTVNVLEAIRQCPSVKSAVIITTDKVYKNKEWQWGYRECEELCGQDPYSNSKSCAELVTYSYRASFFNKDTSPAISTARSGNVIGGGDRAVDRIIPDCVRAIKDKKPLELRNPASTRPYQHVLDCLKGYLMLAEKQTSAGGKVDGIADSWNFGPDEGSSVSTGALVSMFNGELARISGGGGLECRHNEDKTAPHEASFLKLDASRAKALLGWYPAWDIHEAVKRTVEWEAAVMQGEDAKRITDTQILEYFESGPIKG